MVSFFLKWAVIGGIFQAYFYSNVNDRVCVTTGSFWTAFAHPLCLFFNIDDVPTFCSQFTFRQSSIYLK